MAMKMKLGLKLSQRLVMTTMLQQAIKLLPLAKLELVQLIRQELSENPLLDENPTIEEDDFPQREEKITEKKENEDSESDFNWESYFQNRNNSGFSLSVDSKTSSPENRIANEVSLSDYLLWQLSLSSNDSLERCVGAFLIGNIDNDGYLKCDLEEAARHCNVDIEFAGNVLKFIQSFDPPGIAARNLQECLLLQISQLGKNGSLAEKLLENHLEKLEERFYSRIAKEEGVSVDDIIAAVKFIRELNPEPGLKYNPKQIEYIVPDVIVVKVDDDYQVITNNEGIPRLRINPFYEKLLKKKNSMQSADKQYIEDKFKSALWLIKSIEQRRQTLKKVTKSIVKFQREFLDKGTFYLRPLVLRDVAEDIEMHESTVSRITTNKYMHTPQGIFELKYFFHSGIDSLIGDTASSVTVKERIKKIILNENSKRPYTDQKIVELLRKENVIIARRTVTKYRKEMKVLPSSRRKKIYNL